MSYRFDQGHVGVQNVLENVLGVSRAAHAQQLERSALRLNLRAQIGEHLHGVFQRIAFRKLVALHHHFALFVDKDGLGGSRAAVNPHEGAHLISGMELVWHEFLRLVSLFEGGKFVFSLIKSGAALFLLLLRASYVDVPFELFAACINAEAGIFVHRKADAAESCKVLGVVRNHNQVLRILVLRQREIPFFPDLGDIELPAVLHSLDIGVRTAEQENHRPQRIAAREHG